MSTQTNKNETNHTNNSQNQQNQIVTDSDIWQENLRKNEEQRRRQAKWFNLQPGEKATLEFLPDFGPVFKDFDNDGIAETLRYEYKVIHLENKEDGVKPWDLSKSWSESIDYLLKQGHRILRVERVGAGMKTRYMFSPVATGPAAGS